MRTIVTLACTVCKNRNYTTTKNRSLHPGRISHKKYCPHCKKHTEHKQNK
ncbi:MAG: 50S ribosomal protein L33 [Candidatus Cloacimonadota bacterium]|nr:50S ribosomal protein L33 [Candidatus Cloacimonadota bacterium]